MFENLNYISEVSIAQTQPQIDILVILLSEKVIHYILMV